MLEVGCKTCGRLEFHDPYVLGMLAK